MSNLKNAPLIYTIGVVNFPAVPKFENFLVQFHESIREDYPLPTQFARQDLTAQMSEEGVNFETKEVKYWQYASISNDWAVILTETSFCLHTVNYLDFSDFMGKFSKALKALIEIQGIKISWVTSMGFRYVDMITPGACTCIEDYIQPWVLPEKPRQVPLEMEEGIYIAKFKTKIGHLRFQAMRTPPFTLPPDLATPIAAQNGWIRKRPSSDFVIIDTDHAVRFDKGLALELPKLVEKLSDLQGVASDVFNTVGTGKAMTYWKGEAEYAAD